MTITTAITITIKLFQFIGHQKNLLEVGIRFKKQIHRKRKAKAIPCVNRFNISLLFLTSDIAVGEHLMQSKAKIEDVFVGYE